MAHEPSDDLPKTYNGGNRPIVAVLDCGLDESIIDEFINTGYTVVRLPWDVNSEYIATYDPDILFVSDGSGTIGEYGKAAETVRNWRDDIPIVGQGLGRKILQASV